MRDVSGEEDYLYILISLMCLMEKTGFNIFLCFRCCWPIIVTMGEMFKFALRRRTHSELKEDPLQNKCCYVLHGEMSGHLLEV